MDSPPLPTSRALVSPLPFLSAGTSSVVPPSPRKSFLASSFPAVATSRASFGRPLLSTYLFLLVILVFRILFAPVIGICCENRELELSRHGLKLLKRNPSSFTPCVDGRYLLLGSDKELNSSEISKFSKRDAEAYPRCVYLLCMFLYHTGNEVAN